MLHITIIVQSFQEFSWYEGWFYYSTIGTTTVIPWTLLLFTNTLIVILLKKRRRSMAPVRNIRATYNYRNSQVRLSMM